MAGERALRAAGLIALIAVSSVLRTGRFAVPFWIDEGLSVGIAQRPLLDIPGVLLRDGSPPLYYLLLHVWIGPLGLGSGEYGTHALSLLFALAAIPAAWWAGRSLFGEATGWILAALVALSPFLTAYAQETRMYSLVVLLTIGCVACFLHAYAFDRRAYRVPFGVLLALDLYTHNWALFLGVALAAAFAVLWTEAGRPRAGLRDGLVGFGTAALLYAPWLPSLVFQARHTGAPWATAPSLTTLSRAPDLLLGGHSGTVVLVLAGGAGLWALGRRRTRDGRALVVALALLAFAPIVIAWLSSQASPAWATRYLAVALAPLLVLLALGLRHAGRLGVAGLLVLLLAWAGAGAPASKSNVRYVANTFQAMLHPGDIVVSTQPEQLPVLHHYLADGPPLRYATPFGETRELGVTDWRDGAEHFDRTGVDGQLLPLLAGLPRGGQVLLVRPIIERPRRWTAPWTSRVRDRSIEYEGVLRGDPRFELVGIVPQNYRTAGPNPLQGYLFRKIRAG